MNCPSQKLALVQHEQWPNMLAIVGLSFRIVIVVSGRDITPEESAQKVADAEKLVRGFNLLSEAA